MLFLVDDTAGPVVLRGRREGDAGPTGAAYKASRALRRMLHLACEVQCVAEPDAALRTSSLKCVA